MSGVKGKSGRRPNFELRNMAQLQELSLYVLLKALQDPSTSIATKQQIALAVTLKGMANKVDASITQHVSEQDRLVLSKYMPQALTNQALTNQADVVDSE